MKIKIVSFLLVLLFSSGCYAASGWIEVPPLYWGGSNSIAIQSAIDTLAAQGGGTVKLSGLHRISNSIVLKSHVNIIGAGGGILSASGISMAGDISGTVILPMFSGFPVFTNDTGTHIHNFELRNFSIDYSKVTSNLPSSNTNDIGFKFTSKLVDNFRIENVVIKNAYHAYWDNSASWMSVINRVWTRNCRNGFYKIYGTTFTFSNCYAEGSKNAVYDQKGWHIESTYASSLLNCASDKFYSPSSVYLLNNKGLSVIGFDAEYNQSSSGKVISESGNTGLTMMGVTYVN